MWPRRWRRDVLDKTASSEHKKRTDEMEITFRHTMNWLATHTVKAEKEKVINHTKNIFGEWQTEYDYKELSDKVEWSKYSNRGWSNLGWFMLIVAFISSTILLIIFPKIAGSKGLQIFETTTFSLSIFFFILYLYIKLEYLAFYQSDSQFGFIIVITEKNREDVEQMVNFIRSQIKKAKRRQNRRRESIR
jgi:hypothetical protein